MTGYLLDTTVVSEPTRPRPDANALRWLDEVDPDLLYLSAFTLAEFSLPDRLPVSVPSEWARRRPDILAAEAGLRAAHAELGVTFARQYPQLNLSASLGSQALTTSALFGGAAAVWNVVGQLSQPLFNAGLPAERRAALTLGTV